MHIPDSLVEKLLKKSGKVTQEQLNGLLEQAVAQKKSLQDLVISTDVITEHDLIKLYADEIEVPFVELNPNDIKHEVLMLVPERMASQYRVVVFDVDQDGTKNLAMEDPDDIQAVNFLRKQLGSQVRIHLASNANIQAVLDLYHTNTGSELNKVLTTPESPSEEDAGEEVRAEDLAEDSPITQTVNLLIKYAIKAGASDIHIEPREDFVLVRYRVDGILREANKLPKKVHNALVSRIKILSNLKIDERRMPQDGRFKIDVDGKIFALRVSTLPISDGEKVVMRILNESEKAVTLEGLGYWGPSLSAINKAITQPHGMILVTGPTGSGKSTSLYSALSLLNNPSVNISTIEDPIEYKIVGTNQTQVNPKAGMTFASGLRALLRQDPNIIMVGEVRDKETADLAIQAALTGHLVFSTLHTNNAATSLPRLLDMGVEPFLIASTIRAVVGQRLVRRLCEVCGENFQPDEATLRKLGQIFNLEHPAMMKYVHQLEEIAAKSGLGKFQVKGEKNNVQVRPLATTESTVTNLWRAHTGGCDNCNHTGYKGRMGIYEVLPGSSEIQKLIVAGKTSEEIQQEAVREGMVTMQLDGLIKALRGETTVEEILRVTTIDN